jgi:4-oxalocrotonate tautomerase
MRTPPRGYYCSFEIARRWGPERAAEVVFPSQGAGYSCQQASTGGSAMPEIVVYAVGNRPAEQKKALCKDITDAMVKNYKVPAEAVVITLVETPKTDKAKGGVMFSDMAPR